jgi:hypothetical protein
MAILDYSLSINIIFFCLFLAGAFACGFLLFRGQLKRKDAKLNRMEKEMLQAHAEVLASQKEYCALESRIRDLQIPVIPMIQNQKEEITEKEKTGDATSMRKNRSNRTA